jgi:hypothetical protein
MKLKVLLPFLFVAALASAQTNSGPANFASLNSTLFVGAATGWYPTIQATITAACAVGHKRAVRIPAGYLGSDTIAGVTGGCTNTNLFDDRATPVACYTWSGSAYTSAGCAAGSSVTAAAVTSAIQTQGNCNVDATHYWNPFTGTCTVPAGGGSGSANIKYVSAACTGTPIDPTIGLTAAGGAGTDYATCINGLITAAAGAPIRIVVDQSVLTSNIHIPPAGNVDIEGLGAGIANTPVTNCGVASNVATLTAKNSFKVGQHLLMSGLTTCAFMNVPNAESGPYYTVLSSGLSSTQFQVTVSHADIATGAETGYGSYMYGTWLFAAPGTNNDVINVAPNGTLRNSGPNTAPLGRGANVIIRNIAINGNRGNGTDGNSTTGDPRGNNSVSWYSDIHIWDMEDVLIEDVDLYNSPAFALTSDNSGHVKFINSRVDSFLKGQTPASTNQDGAHFNGYSNDLYLSNDYFRTGDDAFALNAPEGYCGPITKVVANNLTFDSVQQFGRAYTRSAACGSGVNPTVTYAAFDGWVGNALNYAWEWGFDTVGALTSSIDHVTWANSRLSAPKGFLHIDTIGELTIDNVKLVDLTSGGFWNSVRFGASATVTTLNLTNDAIVRTAAGSGGHGAVVAEGTSTSFVSTNVNIRNFRVEDEGGSYGATSYLVGGFSGGSITNLLYDYDTANVTTLTTGITITNIKTLGLPNIAVAGCTGCNALPAYPNFNLTDGATIAVNWTNGFTQSVTIAGNRAITFANPVEGMRCIISIKQDATGTRTITSWPAIKWIGGAPPVLTLTPNATDLISLDYIAGVYYGQSALNF